MKPVKHVAIAIVCAAALMGGARAVETMVGQKGKIFTPDEISRAKGETLRIANDDSIPHNVQFVSPSGDKKNLGLQMPGDHADVAVDQIGDYQVVCGIHPKMKLVVHVQ